ncbi:MAG: D-tyrosyl-tRNA(Tyr) deacylase [Clostridia bacterium]|nr:D-tyrosyl-tRNA(Tyr) deacylase [Clostridia bacterium]
MIAVVQRVTSAAVTVEGKITGQCGQGLAILLGVCPEDTEAEAKILAEKIAKLRIFSDEAGKMNRSVVDIGGGAVVVSQFTLMANCSHGNRPDFFGAAPPSIAEPLYGKFTDLLENLLPAPVGRGVFGANMHYEIHNDGPVTIILDTKNLGKKK